MQKLKGKNLIIFDFDNTIFGGDSFDVVVRLHKGGRRDVKLWENYKDDQPWTRFMQNLFNIFFDDGVRVDQIKELIEKTPFVSGMGVLFDFLIENRENYEVIIASDSNTLFINWFLSAKGYDKLFERVYTNPGFVEKEKLVVNDCHTHSCSNCPSNFCKQQILKDHLSKSKHEYNHIFYVGDGENDYCPSKIMRKGDILFPRAGFDLAQLIRREKSNGTLFSHGICPWDKGEDIINTLKNVR